MVVVVPLRIGGGTRLKIFEAMAMGKAMVSTSIGAEGLAVENARDLLLADDANAFADAVIILLRDAAMRRKIEQAAVRLAVQYDWSQVVKQFSAVLRQMTLGSSAGVRRAWRRSRQAMRVSCPRRQSESSGRGSSLPRRCRTYRGRWRFHVLEQSWMVAPRSSVVSVSLAAKTGRGFCQPYSGNGCRIKRGRSACAQLNSAHARHAHDRSDDAGAVAASRPYLRRRWTHGPPFPRTSSARFR